MRENADSEVKGYFWTMGVIPFTGEFTVTVSDIISLFFYSSPYRIYSETGIDTQYREALKNRTYCNLAIKMANQVRLKQHSKQIQTNCAPDYHILAFGVCSV